MSDLVRLPDCPECGQPRWQEAMCACGHSALVHDLNPRAVRTTCLHVTGPQGEHCPCRRYHHA